MAPAIPDRLPPSANKAMTAAPSSMLLNSALLVAAQARDLDMDQGPGY